MIQKMQFATLRDMASMLGVSERTVQRLVIRGELPGFKVGGQWRFNRATVHEWKKRREGAMRQDIEIQNNLDESGVPAGGYAVGRGVDIDWQNGPLGRGETRREPNGAFVEDVIEICMRRIEHYQSTRYKCEENEIAIAKLDEALHALRSRAEKREVRGVEGTISE